MTTIKTILLGVMALLISLGYQVGWAESGKNLNKTEEAIELPSIDVIGVVEKVKTLPGSVSCWIKKRCLIATFLM